MSRPRIHRAISCGDFFIFLPLHQLFVGSCSLFFSRFLLVAQSFRGLFFNLATIPRYRRDSLRTGHLVAHVELRPSVVSLSNHEAANPTYVTRHQ